MSEDQKNLVPNASFECGTDGWGSTELEVLPGWYGTLNGLFGKLDSTTAADGRTSLKIELTPENTPVAYNDYLAHPASADQGPAGGQRRLDRRQAGPALHVLGRHEGGRGGHAGAAGRAAVPRRALRQTRASSPPIGSATRWSSRPTAEACYVLAGPDLGKSRGQSQSARAGDRLARRRATWPPARSRPFATRQPVELGVATDKPGNIFAWDEPLQMRLTVASAEKEARKAELRSLH